MAKGSGSDPEGDEPVSTDAPAYRYYLYGLTFVPILGLWVGFASMQKAYAIIGALFMPMLAATLLILGFRSKALPSAYRNGLVTTLLLLIILIFFLGTGIRPMINAFG